MPTMTNPETGETKEVSMEELMQMMRDGNGSIQQVVKHADGTTSSTTIFGNVSNDGLDRSVNIFIDGDTLNAFIIRKIKKLTGEIEDPESEKDPGELYEMTIDFTDSAIMGILKATKEALTIELYTRDERKATFDYLKQGSKSWKVKADHTIEFNGADLQGEDKTVSLYVLAFLEMRQFLRASGKLAELKELGNRGTGVIIRATGTADDAKATIVRGKNRPDLPCHVFLLGEQMMRPYMDEFMNSMMMSGMTHEEMIEAAEDGDPDAMEELAREYLDGSDEVEQDFEKSAYWWEKLAETGNTVGQFNTGLHYAKGCGVKRDFRKAAEWMKLAAENGDEDAPAVAELYENAAENIRKAEAGDAKAQAEAAKLFMQIGGSLDQFGPQDDFIESFKWGKKAAAQGDLDGIYSLALCYEHGRGTAMDKAEAAATYEKAAVLGHAPSQWNLAVCYLNGSGRERDEVQGYMWAYRAAEQEYDLAVDGLAWQSKTLEQIKDYYEDSQNDVTLQGTQYEGRAARCEKLRKGTELTYKIGKDKNNDEAIELFHNAGSVGFLSKWESAELLALLRLDLINLTVKVKSCIPKSQRGPRARNADVKLTLHISRKKTETPEEKAKRLAEEESRMKAEEAKRVKEAEEKKRREEKRKEAERIRKEQEAAAKAEAARVAAEEAKEKLQRAEKMRSRYQAAAGMLASSLYHVVAVKEDGSVVAAGRNGSGQCNVSTWKDVVAVTCSNYASYGLTSRGTVLTTSSLHQKTLGSWSNIKEIAVNDECVYGLRKDGTVLVCSSAKGASSYSTVGDVTSWKNIEHLRAEGSCIAGIQPQGKVTAIDRTSQNKCEEEYYMNGESSVQDLAYGPLGQGGIILRKDGKIRIVESSRNVIKPRNLSQHNDIVRIGLRGDRPMAILSDGSFVFEANKSHDGKDEVGDFAKKHKINKVAAISDASLFALITEDGRVLVSPSTRWRQDDDIKEDECFGKDFRLFNNFHDMMDKKEAEAERIRKEKEEQEQKRREEEKLKAERRREGVCQHCGGAFKKGLFGSKCVSCGQKKDY